jgi:hypothetical protein
MFFKTTTDGHSGVSLIAVRARSPSEIRSTRRHGNQSRYL